jgi:hypothetical protein
MDAGSAAAAPAGYDSGMLSMGAGVQSMMTEAIDCRCTSVAAAGSSRPGYVSLGCSYFPDKPGWRF